MAASELTRLNRIVPFVALLSVLVLSACNGTLDSAIPKAERPIPERLVKAMKAKGMTRRAPIFVRIFKEDNVLEVWKAKDNGRYGLLESYEICKWSGKLGPKFKEGDRQAPEGFYTVAPAQMNPKSDYYLSFNMGFPNRYDRSHGRTGTHLMVHGACSSAGCYSMTDERVEEIYALAREAFKGGQRKFDIQAFPFRLTGENMARHRDSPNYEFWKMLKAGSDYFEIAKIPPKVDVCGKKYVFNRTFEDGARVRASQACPNSTIAASVEQAYLTKQMEDQKAFDKYVEKQALAEKRKQRQEKIAAALKPKPHANTAIAADQTQVPVADTAQVSERGVANNIPQQRPDIAAANAKSERKKSLLGGLLGFLKSD